MLQLKSILVARDFSACSEQALTYALDLCLRTGAALHTLHAEVLYSDPNEEVRDPEAERIAIRRRLHELVGLNRGIPYRAGADSITMKSEQVRDVAPAPAILSYAEEQGIDLIVMGTHGRRGFRRMLLGSVAAEVVRLSNCPVMTVRCDDQLPIRTQARTIVVPIDFSAHALVALRHAKAFADLHDASIALIHVVEDRLHPAFYNAGVFSVYDVQPDIEERAEQQLRQFAEEAGCLADRLIFEIRPGHAGREIAAYAREREADLIVMSTHGLTGIEYLFMGSVAEKVVRIASCPVLTIRTSARSLVGEPVAVDNEKGLPGKPAGPGGTPTG